LGRLAAPTKGAGEYFGFRLDPAGKTQRRPGKMKRSDFLCAAGETQLERGEGIEFAGVHDMVRYSASLPAPGHLGRGRKNAAERLAGF
jgi:hypothetical protein